MLLPGESFAGRSTFGYLDGAFPAQQYPISILDERFFAELSNQVGNAFMSFLPFGDLSLESVQMLACAIEDSGKTRILFALGLQAGAFCVFDPQRRDDGSKPHEDDEYVMQLTGMFQKIPQRDDQDRCQKTGAV